MIKRILNIITVAFFGLTTGLLAAVIFNNFFSVQISRPEIMKFSHQHKAYRSIVFLNINNQGSCTGSVISDNYVLTAGHCVVDSFGMLTNDPIYVESTSDILVQVKGKAVAVDMLRDVGFIVGDFVNFQHAKVDFKGSHVISGMPVVSCGYPGGSPNLYCVQLNLVGNHFFKHRAIGAPIFKGMSGGPVVDMNDVIIGVNSGVTRDSVTIGPVVGILDSLGIYGY